MSNGSAAYHFLPWVRYGVAAGLKGPPVLGKKAEYEPGKNFIPSRAPIPITVRLKGEGSNDDDVPVDLRGVTVDLRGYGPGDVVGIDPREVVRTEPRHLVTDFPPHLFPFIEFDRPDFPWLFTPAAPDAEGCLRPWIILIVVRKQDAKLTTDPTKPLPVLRCKVKELPNLEESWAWVHAQYVGDAGETQSEVKAGLIARPQQNVSRLLCPRKLAEHQGGDNGYLACVVPAFKAGVQAGNGDMPDDKLEPAWKVTDDGEIDLPVYYHWEFGTGAKGDFEDLIDGLELRNLPAGSSRLMDASQPGGGMSEYQGMTLGIASALQAPQAPQAPEPLPGNFTSSNFQQDIQKLLDPAQTVSAGAAVPPPIYGGWYVPSATPGRPSLDEGAAPPWLRELNLDPRYRVAAALGTQVVQRQQEQLVAAAWEQAAQLQAVNQWLKQKQLGSVVTASIYEKRLAILSEDTFWQLTAPAGACVNLGAERTQRSAALLSSTDGVAPQETAPTALKSPLAKAIVSAPFRRLARPGGRLSRQAAVPAIQPEVSDAVAPVGAPARQPGGLLERIRTGCLRVAPPGAPAVASGISDHGSMPDLRLRPIAEPFATPVTLGIPEEQIRLMKKLDPYQTFREEARERIEGPSSERTDSLQPISDVPLRFPQPMYEPLRELFQDMLLPGLDRIRNDSLVELSANPAFIEAYLVGLNHELARELLWREFPTHLDSTYFRQFWDVRGSLSPSASAEERERFLDIPEIRDWKAPLGSNMPAPRGSNLFMLLIKGDLLVRYPNAVISVRRAVDAPPKFPMLRINPVPGVTLLGFDLEPSPLKASPSDPGWFFVFEEHPTETRFGLDISGGVLNSWRELTWDNVKTQDNGYIRVTGSDATPQPSPPDPRAVWGRNGADMAYITLQKAYRLRVHSNRWSGKGPVRDDNDGR